MKTEQIATERLNPNDWNPNRMGDEELAELVAEVRHLEGLPKPVVVRQHEDGFEIIDGEHGWAAAKEVRLDTIPCEVVDADDFEAMRQTYKRNQHGRHNPVLQGRLFLRMMDEKKLSARKLAGDIGVSEGTVRNSILHAEAAKVRNDYAPDRDTDSEVSAMSVQGVRYYLSLPAILRDHWLDAGGDLDYFESFEFDPESCQRELAEIAESELAAVLVGKIRGFVPRLVRLVETLREWRNHGRVFFDRAGGFHAYLRPLLENDLPNSLIDTLPLVGDENDQKVAIPASEWQRLVANVVTQIPDRKDRAKFIDMAVVTYARERGILVDNENSPVQQFLKAHLHDAPDYIRLSRLTLHDRAWLQDLPDIDKERMAKHLTENEIDQLKHDVVDAIEFRGKVLTGESDRSEITAAARSAGMNDPTCFAKPVAIEAIFVRLLDQRVKQKTIEKRRQLFNDRRHVEELAIAKVRESGVIQEDEVQGRPAIDVFAERIRAMEWPELRMLCVYLLDRENTAAGAAQAFWLEAVDGQQPDKDSAKSA